MSREKEFQALVTLAGSVDPSYEDSFKQARKTVDNFEKASSKTNKTTEVFKKTSDAMFSTLTQAAGTLLASGIQKSISAITGSLDSAIDRVDTLNSYEKTMQNLGYSMEEVAAASKTLQEGIDGLPTTLPGITSMQQQYAALTGDIGKAAELTVALNDATLAGGQGQEVATRAAEQWYKVIAKGKPDLQSWTTINSAMPAQMNQIAQSLLGAEAKSQDLFEAWKNGKVTTEQVQEAVIALDKEGGKGFASFAEQAQDATGGIATSMSNIKTAITTGVANVIQNIGPSGLSGVLNKAKGSIKAGFADIADSVNLLKEGDFEGAIAKIGGVFESMLSSLDTNLPKVAQKVGEMVPVIVAGFAANLPAITDAGLQIITGLINGIADGAPYLVTALADVVPQVVSTVLSDIPQLISAGMSIIEGLTTGIIQALPILVGHLPEVISSIVECFFGSQGEIKKSGASLLVALVDGLVQAIPEMIAHVPDIIDSFVIAFGEHYSSFVMSGLEAIDALISGFAAAIPKLVSSVISMVGTILYTFLANAPKVAFAGIQIVVSFVGAILGRIGLVISAIARIGASIISTISRVPGQMASVGIRIVQGIWSGIMNGAGWLKAKLSGWVQSITSHIKGLFGIHSPSRVLADEVGKFLPPGIAVGFEYEMPDALSKMKSSLNESIAKLSSDVNVTSNVQHSLYQPAASSVVNHRPRRTATVGTMLNQQPSFSLAPSTSKTKVNMGGISFSPTVKIETKSGEKLKPETVLKALRDFEPEFIDFVMDALSKREEGVYAEGAALY